MSPDARPPFPTYLLPPFTFPFRRRPNPISPTITSNSPPSLSHSSSSSSDTSPSSSPPSPNSLHQALLHDALQRIPWKRKRRDRDIRLGCVQPSRLKCVTCASDIAFADQIVSKGFTGRHGRAYLVSLPPTEVSMSSGKKGVDGLPNTKIGRSVNRELLTGQHIVADVSCYICDTVLGWKYVDAREEAQKYKIGKYILEMKRVVPAVGWEDMVGEDENVEQGDRIYREASKVAESGDMVLFDSEDEDECDELFAGTWDPEIVAKRRGKRVWSRKKNNAEV
ncbi:yippee family protein [Diplocarpon rosae]|nr:yippee family protein [Diplocarpon rosae]